LKPQILNMIGKLTAFVAAAVLSKDVKILSVLQRTQLPFQ